ncbi:MAG: AI-2E family transporter, partial [Oscillibacter sp.]|nr:AI-2E family transporter [Oscillibacter sp.]
QKLTAVLGVLMRLLGILGPFLVGGAIAFVLNVPMTAIERHLPARKKARRPLSLLLTLAAMIGVLTLAFCVIGPGIGEAVGSIGHQIPAAVQRLQTQLEELEALLPQLETLADNFQLDIDWNALSRRAMAMAQDFGSRLLSSGGGLIGGVVSGVSIFVIGLIFSFYVLLQKEKLARQGRQVCYALLPERWADKTLEVLRLANRTFGSFLSGQCLEAVILGTLFVVAMTLFRMPYALLVGVLISLTALIPVVGAFIGCAVGALLIAVTDPWRALWFILLFIVIQQIEGNFIYPHVVGSSVGLPSIWVLAAVTLGGSLMGISGMVFFIPLCSVLYALFRDFIKTRLRKRGVPPGKWRDPA